VNFFPKPDSPDLAPFTRAFLRMMFAHVEFKRRVAELADVIALSLGSEKSRPLSGPQKTAPRGSESSAPNIRASTPAACRKPMPSCDVSTRRSLSATIGIGWPHGVWWRFDANFDLLDVHTVRVRCKEPRSREFMVEQIQRIADAFSDIDVNLWKLQRAIEDRLPPDCWPPSNSTDS